MLRRKGRVVPVGDVGLGLERERALRARGGRPDLDLVRARAATTRPTRRAGSTTRSPTCAGPRTATWRSSCACSRRARCSVEPLVELELPRRARSRGLRARSPATRRRWPRCSPTTGARPRRRAPEVVRVARRAGGAAHGERRGRAGRAGSFVRGVHLPNLQRDGGVRDQDGGQPRRDLGDRVARSLDGAEAATDWREAVERSRRRPRPRRHAARHATPRSPPPRCARQGGVRREAARPDPRGDRRRLGGGRARTTASRSASTGRSRRSSQRWRRRSDAADRPDPARLPRQRAAAAPTTG